MDEILVELIQRIQLEHEALAELVAGNPAAARSWGEQRMQVRGILDRSGHGIAVLPDPYLETALRLAATAEQGRRMAR